MRTPARSALMVALIAVALLAFSLQGAALKPDSFWIHDEYDLPVAACSGFDLMEDAVIDFHVTTYFDRNGDPVKFKVHGIFKSVLYNSVDPDKSFHDSATWTETFNLEDGTLTQVGAVFHSTIPGEGVVVRYLGRIVFDGDGNVIFEAGQHDYIALQDLYDAECPYFA